MSNIADIIYTNGAIYTQNPDQPRATAVACCDGKILAVGGYNDMHGLIDEGTEIIDLEGKYMFPGFIEVHDSPVFTTFGDVDEDFDAPLGEINAAIDEIMEDYCDRGITTVFNMCGKEVTDNLYQNRVIQLINDEELRQRFYGSFSIKDSMDSSILCAKLIDGKSLSKDYPALLDYSFLKINLDNEFGTCFDQESLNKIVLAACDKGFNIHIDGNTEETLEMAYRTFDTVRAKAYNKNVLVIASDLSLSEEEQYDINGYETIIKTWATDFECGSVYNRCDNAKEALMNYTIEAAKLIGASKVLGSIEKGKFADFTIFNDNPLELGLDQMSYMHAEQTVLNGIVVYDAEEAANDELYNILLTQQL